MSQQPGGGPPFLPGNMNMIGPQRPPLHPHEQQHFMPVSVSQSFQAYGPPRQQQPPQMIHGGHPMMQMMQPGGGGPHPHPGMMHQHHPQQHPMQQQQTHAQAMHQQFIHNQMIAQQQQMHQQQQQQQHNQMMIRFGGPNQGGPPHPHHQQHSNPNRQPLGPVVRPPIGMPSNNFGPNHQQPNPFQQGSPSPFPNQQQQMQFRHQQPASMQQQQQPPPVPHPLMQQNVQSHQQIGPHEIPASSVPFTPSSSVSQSQQQPLASSQDVNNIIPSSSSSSQASASVLPSSIPATIPVPQPQPTPSSTSVLPYFDLPAGLMVPMVKLEDWEYKALDPSDVRLPLPAPPSDRLLKAVESFYSPPTHDRPRNNEGWETLGLYDFYREKAGATEGKAGSLSSLPVLYNPFEGKEDKKEEVKEEKKEDLDEEGGRKRRFREEKDGSSSNARKISIGGSSSWKESSNKDSRRKDRGKRMRSTSSASSSDGSSASSRSPSPDNRRHHHHHHRSRDNRNSSSNRKYSPIKKGGNNKSNIVQQPHSFKQRSPSPEPFKASFSLVIPASTSTSSSKLDPNENKGLQLLKKMGWSGSGGLGSSEQGISEPISASDVRDASSLYHGIGMEAPSSSSQNDPYESYRRNRGQQFLDRIVSKATTTTTLEKPK